MFLSIAGLVSFLLNGFMLIGIIVPPIRERIFGIRKVNNGHKCLLRSEMLKIYYNYKNEKQIRQYEYENFVYLYDAYKALKGNSFIDHVYEEINTWQIIP